jgi:adenylate cyclase
LSGIIPSAYLEVEIDGTKSRFSIPEDTALRIGRSETVSLVLDDESVSRRHALLQRAEDDQYYITDLGSSNGTYVNQQRVSTPVILQSGDIVSIGSFTLTFCREADPQIMASAKSRATNHVFAPKLITVMVADIRDFSLLAQRIDARALSEIVGTLFREAGKVLHDRGTWAQKYIGDAVMAVWVHPAAEPGIKEFWAIFDALSQVFGIAAGIQESHHLSAPIRLGVGINTGWASVGNVGSIATADYTALGEVVNKAFRLESATRELGCELALGEETYDFLGDLIDAKRIFSTHSIKLKGYEKPTTAYAASLALLPSLLGSLLESTVVP